MAGYVLIVNSDSDSDCTLHVEPWGDSYTICPDKSLEVRFAEDQPGPLEITYYSSGILLGVLTEDPDVFCDGIKLQSK